MTFFNRISNKLTAHNNSNKDEHKVPDNEKIKLLDKDVRAIGYDGIADFEREIVSNLYKNKPIFFSSPFPSLPDNPPYWLVMTLRYYYNIELDISGPNDHIYTLSLKRGKYADDNMLSEYYS